MGVCCGKESKDKYIGNEKTSEVRAESEGPNMRRTQERITPERVTQEARRDLGEIVRAASPIESIPAEDPRGELAQAMSLQRQHATPTITRQSMNLASRAPPPLQPQPMPQPISSPKQKTKSKSKTIDVFDPLAAKKMSELNLPEDGLKPHQINSIIPAKFKKANVKTDDPSKLECNICLVPFEDGDETKTLQCLHTYHSHCINSWLAKKCICPECKFNLRALDISQLL